MKTIIILILVISGTVLLALDRLIGKEAVIRLDCRLEIASDRFRPLDRRKHFLFFLVGMSCLAFWMAVRIEGSPPPEVLHWLCIIMGGVAYWIIAGLILAIREGRGKHLWLALVFGMLTPFLLIWFFIISICRLLLYPFLFPLKGVVLLKRRWFQSLSGVIGLAAVIVGTILQFL